MYLTLPVLTAVNPGQRGLTAYDFFVAPSTAAANSSQRIIGYLQLAISRAALLDAIGPVVGRVFFGSLGLIALCGVGIALMTRRITRDLSRLARLADEVAAGEWQKPVEISAGSEVRDIANVLNQVIAGFTRLQQEADIGNRLLSQEGRRAHQPAIQPGSRRSTRRRKKSARPATGCSAWPITTA